MQKKKKKAKILFKSLCTVRLFQILSKQVCFIWVEFQSLEKITRSPNFGDNLFFILL